MHFIFNLAYKFIGVKHMENGLVLKLINYIVFHDRISLLF